MEHSSALVKPALICHYVHTYHCTYLTYADVQKALLEERGKVKEEFAEMERRMNEVRREHAKMAVMLQQTKRDAIRERERLVRSHELEREQLEEEVDTYKAKLSSITAERNLLAVSICLRVIECLTESLVRYWALFHMSKASLV